MKILLLGNYANNRQESMSRFANVLLKGLAAAGHEVRLVRPPAVFGRLRPGSTGPAKWIGYIDRFVLYPPILRQQVRWADVVHICDQANAVYLPHLGGKPYILTCHDVLAIRSALGEIREQQTGWTGTVYQHWILKNLRKMQLVVCVSRQTFCELQRVAGISAERMAVIPNGLNYPYSPMAKHEAVDRLKALGVDAATPFFIHVGGNQWYKNRPGVLRLFGHLAQLPNYWNHNLVMAGKPWTREMHQIARQTGVAQRAIELTEVTNEDLRALYSTAEALLFPSLHEGFGWPIVEAQACGCPVITADRPPMTEIGGSASIRVDLSDAVKAAHAIAQQLPVNRQRIATAGLANAARFSTESMIAAYAETYRDAIAAGSVCNAAQGAARRA